MLHEIRVSGTTNAKIPHLYVHKPKSVVVETVLMIFVLVGHPLYVVALLQSMFPLLLSMFAQAHQRQPKSGWANMNITYFRK